MLLLARARQQQQLAPLPIKDALAELKFADGVPIDLSPDGEWVAYTLQQDERRKKTESDPKYGIVTRTGILANFAGCDVWIANLRSGEAKNLTEGEGSNWGPVWSPDGERLAFYSDRYGQARVWLWEKATETVRKVSDVFAYATFPTESVKWTPDGTKLLLTVLPEGMSVEEMIAIREAPLVQPSAQRQKEPGSTVTLYSALAQTQADREQARAQRNGFLSRFLADLALIDISSGNVKRLVRRGTPAGRWISPDGRSIAFTSHKGIASDKEFQPIYDLAVVSLADGRMRILASDILLFGGFTVSWSPESNALAYITSGPLAKGDCFVVTTSGGEPRNLTQRPHPDFSSGYHPPVWDANGRSIYLFGLDALWKALVAEGTAAEIARIPEHTILQIVTRRGIDLFRSSDDGQTPVLMARDNETKQSGFYKIDLGTGKLLKLLEESKSYNYAWNNAIDMSADGKRIIYLAQSAQQSEDIWAVRADFRDPQRVTHANPQFGRYVMGASRLIEWQNAEGQKLRGTLLLPAEYKKGTRYPLIVWQYPAKDLSHYANFFGFAPSVTLNLQLFATRGYAVLLPNVPIRLGANMQDISRAVMPGVDKLIEMGIADPDRLGTIGQSYGGYGVLSLIVQTTRFKAAIVSAGHGDLIGSYSAMQANGSSTYTGQYENLIVGGTLWEKRETFIENSPLFYLDRVQTPLLILHGAADTSIPPFLADEIFVCLRRLGKEVEYAKYEGEEHSPPNWSYANHVDYVKRIIAWFDEHLKSSDSPKVEE
jgi:dipeptidyl aminopeptidase/acylaminoacyl peptidase